MKTDSPPKLLQLAMALSTCLLYAAQGAPFVEITNIPPYGSGGYLEGRAPSGGSEPLAVAVYIKVNEKWWTKPCSNAPLTFVQSDGSWGFVDPCYHTNDNYATQYAVFLVALSDSNDVPVLSGVPVLPPVLDEIALAKEFRIRTGVLFSGLQWEAKTALLDKYAPGTNWFSPTNAWVDSSNRLHLKITEEPGVEANEWHCAEVICGREFGYGLYRFYVEDSPIGSLAPNVVFSPFTYSDHTNHDHREIDMEFTVWKDPATNGTAQYAIHAPDRSDIVQRFEQPADVTNSVHSFVWSPWRVDFRSLKGDRPATTEPSNVITNWSFTNSAKIPPAGPVRPRINLYLCDGLPPSDANEVEVIVSRFEYEPLIRFSSIHEQTNASLRMTIVVQVPGRLIVERSGTIAPMSDTWQPIHTNVCHESGRYDLIDSNATGSNGFYRAVLLP